MTTTTTHDRRSPAAVATYEAALGQVSARALFGTLVDGDAHERRLIGGLLTGLAQLMGRLRTDPTGYAMVHHLYRDAERLERLQDREDPLHRLGCRARKEHRLEPNRGPIVDRVVRSAD